MSVKMSVKHDKVLKNVINKGFWAGILLALSKNHGTSQHIIMCL